MMSPPKRRKTSVENCTVTALLITSANNPPRLVTVVRPTEAAKKPIMIPDPAQDQEFTGNKDSDFLHLYLTGSMYDCSLKVGCPNTGFQVFKCHRLLLSTASPVFKNMFYENFKEAAMGADDAITMRFVSPTAFDLTMRSVYGNTKDFGDLTTAAEIYRFAHEMQISGVIKAVEQHIKQKATPEDIFAVYESFKLTDNAAGLEWSWNMIKNRTSETIKSGSWKTVSVETVQVLLSANRLNVNHETELLEALIVWGKAQVQKEQGYEPTEVQVREKIKDHLKLIRFASMDTTEFAEMCRQDLTILTAEEKHSILLSLTLESGDLLPADFSKEKRDLVVHAKTVFLNLPLQLLVSEYSPQATVHFTTDTKVCLVGVRFDETMGLGAVMQSFELEDDSDFLCSGDTHNKCVLKGKEFLAVEGIKSLVPNLLHKMIITFKCDQIKRGKPLLVLHDREVKSELLTVKVMDGKLRPHVELAFEPFTLIKKAGEYKPF